MPNAVSEDTRIKALGTNVPAMRSASPNSLPQSFVPADFAGMMELGSLMAQGGPAVPKHLRNNPAACLSVAMVATQVGMNPFLLAADTYQVGETIAYGAKAMVAMVNQSRLLKGRLRYELGGQWPKRTCKVTGILADDNEPRTLTIFAETITVRNSPNWKQQPDIQLQYYAGRAWARLYAPEILLGMVGQDEMVDGGHLSAGADGTYRASNEPDRRPSSIERRRLAAEPGPAPAQDADIIDVPDEPVVDTETGEVMEPVQGPPPAPKSAPAQPPEPPAQPDGDADTDTGREPPADAPPPPADDFEADMAALEAKQRKQTDDAIRAIGQISDGKALQVRIASDGYRNLVRALPDALAADLRATVQLRAQELGVKVED